MTRSALSIAVAISALAVGCSDSRIDRRTIPPTVEIVTPEDDAVFRQGEGPIQLNGIVYDSAQTPESLEVLWVVNEEDEYPRSADVDGFVPLDLNDAGLVPGENVATLYAVDFDGATGSASVRFYLAGPLTAPTVTITSPADGSGFDGGESITFTGEAVDSATPVEDLSFEWFADGVPMEGAVTADGQSIVVWSSVLAGLRTVELRVTDGDGDVGADTVGIRIGEDITPTEPGDVVFSEMNVNPEIVEDEVGEWIELYNTAGHPIDIGGYTFRDDGNDSYELEPGLVVGSGEYFVLCADMDSGVNGGVPCDGSFLRNWQGNGVALGNGEDELVLTRPDGVEIDWLHYDSSWYVPGNAIGVHPQHLNGGDNDDPAHWCLQTTVFSAGGEPGTPGRPNDPC